MSGYELFDITPLRVLPVMEFWEVFRQEMYARLRLPAEYLRIREPRHIPAPPFPSPRYKLLSPAPAPRALIEGRRSSDATL